MGFGFCSRRLPYRYFRTNAASGSARANNLVPCPLIDKSIETMTVAPTPSVLFAVSRKANSMTVSPHSSSTIRALVFVSRISTPAGPVMCATGCGYPARPS